MTHLILTFDAAAVRALRPYVTAADAEGTTLTLSLNGSTATPRVGGFTDGEPFTVDTTNPLLRLAQHLASRERDQWSTPTCELTTKEDSGRCRGEAVGVRWEDGFADLVCEGHAEDAEARGAIVVRARRHDGTLTT